VDRLEIQNLAIIDRLEVTLGSGLNVFTGETGAGKSIIVDAIWLLTGARSDAELVRSGEESLLVTGFWGENTASRRVTREGRSTARVDGEVVSVRELGERTAKFVTVHWQHAAQALLDPRYHRELLDAGLDAKGKTALENVREKHRAFSDANARLEALREGERERARRVDLLSYQLREIESANLNPQEETSLRQDRDRLANAENIIEHASAAVQALDEADVNALGLLGDAVKALEKVARFDSSMTNLASDVREAISSLQAVSVESRDLIERVSGEPGALDRVEGRLALLDKLKAKYGATIEDVLIYADELQAELNTLERASSDAAELERQITPLRAALETWASKLSQARRDTAARLAPKLESIVRSLGMPKAQLEFALKPTSIGAFGAEDIEIRFSANPGEALGALDRIASGGELSRVMLAISSVLGANTPTVIFDEVDAGIGGQAALAVADQLQRLSRNHQVMVVTHLAQIAARADHHYRVRKEESAGRTRVALEKLDGEARVLELARMLSGTDSRAAVEHARELLAVKR
jgi:DNA repair protein RecN (Recombination protein N)